MCFNLTTNFYLLAFVCPTPYHAFIISWSCLGSTHFRIISSESHYAYFSSTSSFTRAAMTAPKNVHMVHTFQKDPTSAGSVESTIGLSSDCKNLRRWKFHLKFFIRAHRGIQQSGACMLHKRWDSQSSLSELDDHRYCSHLPFSRIPRSGLSSLYAIM